MAARCRSRCARARTGRTRSRHRSRDGPRTGPLARSGAKDPVPVIDRATFDRQRELAKLGRLLALQPERLGDLDAADLRTVREALSSSLFDAGRPALRRVASASKLLPNGTVARVG